MVFRIMLLHEAVCPLEDGARDLLQTQSREAARNDVGVEEPRYVSTAILCDIWPDI